MDNQRLNGHTVSNLSVHILGVASLGDLYSYGMNLMMRYFEFRRGELKDNSHSHLIEVQLNMNLKAPSGFAKAKTFRPRTDYLRSP